VCRIALHCGERVGGYGLNPSRDLSVPSTDEMTSYENGNLQCGPFHFPLNPSIIYD
jgi:hypothetical protein